MELRTKSVEQSIADTDEESTRLGKDLSWWDLTVLLDQSVTTSSSTVRPVLPDTNPVDEHVRGVGPRTGIAATGASHREI